MSPYAPLLARADAIIDAGIFTESTLSAKLFNDSTRLARLRTGKDVTVTTHERALRKLDDIEASNAAKLCGERLS